LVIDDDELVGRTIKRLLSGEHDVVVERDARIAVARLLAGESFDVVLCELRLPKINGIEVYVTIFRADPDAAARLVFMSGSEVSDDTELFLQTSGRPLLEKPFDISYLRAVVNGLVH
jgi:CheY-like chemotaxis protein